MRQHTRFHAPVGMPTDKEFRQDTSVPTQEYGNQKKSFSRACIPTGKFRAQMIDKSINTSLGK